jgi:hypothetical protein
MLYHSSSFGFDQQTDYASNRQSQILNFIRGNPVEFPDFSVNLVVNGNGVWQPLLRHIAEDNLDKPAQVDLESHATASRRGLISEMLTRLGLRVQIPPAPEDLVELSRVLPVNQASYVALTHFDIVRHRHNYEIDLFASLRHLIMAEPRRLVLLVQSRMPFAALWRFVHGNFVVIPINIIYWYLSVILSKG